MEKCWHGEGCYTSCYNVSLFLCPLPSFTVCIWLLRDVFASLPHAIATVCSSGSASGCLLFHHTVCLSTNSDFRHLHKSSQAAKVSWFTFYIVSLLIWDASIPILVLSISLMSCSLIVMIKCIRIQVIIHYATIHLPYNISILLID